MCKFKHISIHFINTTKWVMYVIVWDVVVVSHHVHICIKPILSWHFIRSCWQTASLMYMNDTFQNSDPVVNSGEHACLAVYTLVATHSIAHVLTKINKPNYEYNNPLIAGSKWHLHRWVLHFWEVQWPDTIFMSWFFVIQGTFERYWCVSVILFSLLSHQIDYSCIRFKEKACYK